MRLKLLQNFCCAPDVRSGALLEWVGPLQPCRRVNLLRRWVPPIWGRAVLSVPSHPWGRSRVRLRWSWYMWPLIASHVLLLRPAEIWAEEHSEALIMLALVFPSGSAEGCKVPLFQEHASYMLWRGYQRLHVIKEVPTGIITAKSPNSL